MTVGKMKLQSKKNSLLKALPFGEPGTLQHRVLLQDKDGTEVSPWHDIPLYAAHGCVNFVCKTPKGSWAEYEPAIREPSAPLKLACKNRGPAHFSSNVPWNYGMLPRTWSDPEVEHDEYGGLSYSSGALEVIVLGSRIAQTGEVYAVKPLASFALVNEAGLLSWKIIGIEANDPLALKLRDAKDVEKLLGETLRDIQEWLRTCHCTESGDRRHAFGLNERPVGQLTVARIVAEAHASWQLLMEKNPPSRASALPLVKPAKPSAYEAYWSRYTFSDSTSKISLTQETTPSPPPISVPLPDPSPSPSPSPAPEPTSPSTPTCNTFSRSASRRFRNRSSSVEAPWTDLCTSPDSSHPTLSPSPSDASASNAENGAPTVRATSSGASTASSENYTPPSPTSSPKHLSLERSISSPVLAKNYRMPEDADAGFGFVSPRGVLEVGWNKELSRRPSPWKRQQAQSQHSRWQEEEDRKVALEQWKEESRRKSMPHYGMGKTHLVPQPQPQPQLQPLAQPESQPKFQKDAWQQQQEELHFLKQQYEIHKAQILRPLSPLRTRSKTDESDRTSQMSAWQQLQLAQAAPPMSPTVVVAVSKPRTPSPYRSRPMGNPLHEILTPKANETASRFTPRSPCGAVERPNAGALRRQRMLAMAYEHSRPKGMGGAGGVGVTPPHLRAGRGAGAMRFVEEDPDSMAVMLDENEFDEDEVMHDRFNTRLAATKRILEKMRLHMQAA